MARLKREIESKTRYVPQPYELIEEINKVRAYYKAKAEALTVRAIADKIGCSPAYVQEFLTTGQISDPIYEATWEWWSLAQLHFPHSPVMAKKL